ncbi:MAG TPA: ABC transporter ATP-binding protein [Candidatus Fermentibacter daniensis]|nr:ABC transporter ATP-binding protein [Candidatus Fermentibacter daniensis]
MTAPAVEAEDLARRFGDVEALAGASFSVDPGGIFGIVGPDGSGKTTCLRMLSTVLTPSSGHARILGFDTVESPWRVKDRTGYMSQQFGLYDDLTVEENLSFFAGIYGVTRVELHERAGRLLEFSGMGPFMKRRAGRLSGGMKQKLALMCALVHTPEVLLLDEPTNGVDPVSRRDFWAILHDLVRGGMTVVISTSYLDEAERCGRVILLDKGRIRAGGSPADLLGGSGLSVVEIPTPEPWKAAGILSETIGAGCRAEPRGDRVRLIMMGKAIPDPSATLRASGIPFSLPEAVDPTLEDVLSSLVREDPHG